jgi:hypothetical protein
VEDRWRQANRKQTADGADYRSSQRTEIVFTYRRLAHLHRELFIDGEQKQRSDWSKNDGGRTTDFFC